MNKWLTILLILAVNISFSQGFKEVTDTSALKQKMYQKAQNTNTISANFDEAVYSSMYSTVKQGKGLLKYKKEDKIRWEHTAPKSQVILIRNGTCRVYENGKEVKNGTSNQVARKVQSLMMQLFNGNFLDGKDFTIRYFENSKMYKLILDPKYARISRYISQIEMFFNKSDLSLQKLALVETEQDKIIYSFSSVTMNGNIEDDHFTKY